MCIKILQADYYLNLSNQRIKNKETLYQRSLLIEIFSSSNNAYRYVYISFLIKRYVFFTLL